MKKNIPLLLLIITFFSCTGFIKSIPKINFVGAVSFNKYTDKGFLFTPHDYKSEYESIGLMSATLMPRAEYERVKTGEIDNAGGAIYKSFWNIEKVNIGEALDSLYEKAIHLGADAIIDLRIKERLESYNVNYPPMHVTIIGYDIEGFAIKRIKNEEVEKQPEPLSAPSPNPEALPPPDQGDR